MSTAGGITGGGGVRLHYGWSVTSPTSPSRNEEKSYGAGEIDSKLGVPRCRFHCIGTFAVRIA